jgi:hypothetical protein
MQEGEGKATRKLDEIAPTPPRGNLTEVTPCPTVNERAHAKAKKKKGLEGYFGTGARVPPPNREGTPINAVGKRRGEEDRTNAHTARGGGRTPNQGHRGKSNKKGEGDRRGNREESMPNLEGTSVDAVDIGGGGEDMATDCTGGEGKRSTVPTTRRDKGDSNKGRDGNQKGNQQKATSNPERSLIGAGGRIMREVEKATNTTGEKQQPSTETTAHGRKAKSSKEGEDNQRRTCKKLSTKSKKSARNNLDNDLSRRSKKTRSDDDASSPADATGNGDAPNLEGIKGSLRKKGSGSATPKGSEQKAKKTAMFAEAVSKGATDKSAPAIAHMKCVVAFSVRVDKREGHPGCVWQGNHCHIILSPNAYRQAGCVLCNQRIDLRQATPKKGKS